MAVLYINSNYPVSNTVWYAGELAQPDDGIVEVDIYDTTNDPAVSPPINPGVRLTTISATPSETDSGTFRVILPLDLLRRQREFRLVWRYDINGEHVYSESHIEVIKPYCDLVEAMAYLGLGTDPSDPNWRSFYELQNAETYARKTIENFTNQSFMLYDDVQVAWGGGTNVLPLPFKISQIHEIYADDYLLIDNINNINNWGYEALISESGFGVRINTSTSFDNTVYIANGQLPPTVNDISYSGAFKKDVRYRIQGKFGWDEVPENVEEACMILMGDYFNRETIWRNKYVKRISSYDMQLEFSEDAQRGTGNAYVDQLLLPYVINGMVVI